MKSSIKVLSVMLAAAWCFAFSACSGDGGANSTIGTGASADTSGTVQEAPADGADGDKTLQTEAAPQSELWKNAYYTEDTELGEGAVTVKVKVIAEDKSITVTVHTDRDMLGAALLDNKLISGDEGEYGLFIKFVNGIEADYDKSGAYWAISRDGEYLMTGADATPIADGENYELTYTKG